MAKMYFFFFPREICRGGGEEENGRSNNNQFGRDRVQACPVMNSPQVWQEKGLKLVQGDGLLCRASPVAASRELRLQRVTLCLRLSSVPLLTPP